MNNIVMQRCLFYMYIMHFLNLKISFPFCSLKFTYLRYTVGGGGESIKRLFANYYFYYFHFRLQRKDKATFI